MKKNNSQNTAAEIEKLGQELLTNIEKILAERDKKILAIINSIEAKKIEQIQASIKQYGERKKIAN